MKLEVNISKKLGVINITSNSFVLEDLKAHICKKMKLNENDFKMKISFGDVPKVEMIEVINKKNPLEPFKQIEALEDEILSKVKTEFSKADFVSIGGNYDKTKLKITIHFKDFKDGEAITYFGNNEKDYNKPINPQLEKRCSAVYKILKPYLGAK